MRSSTKKRIERLEQQVKQEFMWTLRSTKVLRNEVDAILEAMGATTKTVEATPERIIVVPLDHDHPSQAEAPNLTVVPS